MSIDINSLVREDIKDMAPYEPHIFENVIKMDANENPYDFPAEIWQEIFTQVGQTGFTRYPDPLAKSLRQELSLYTGVPAEQIIVGNGSDELIQLLLQTFGGPGTRSVIPYPTFSMYAIHTRITGGTPVGVPLRDDFTLPVDEVIKENKVPGSKITFLCTPNNPTGSLIPVSEVETILQNSNGIVVADEAYLEFYGLETCTSLLEKYNNLAIIRTFSKAFALAGLRVGYMLASTEIISSMMKLKQPYNVNVFSQEAAKLVLRHRDKFKTQVDSIIAERDRLFALLQQLLGVTAYPSGANYIMFKTAKPGSDVHKQLIAQGILIRDLNGGSGLANCLRVSMGKKEENDLFLEKLKTILA